MEGTRRTAVQCGKDGGNEMIKRLGTSMRKDECRVTRGGARDTERKASAGSCGFLSLDTRPSTLSIFFTGANGENRESFQISVSSVASCEKVTVTIAGRVSKEKRGMRMLSRGSSRGGR
jgi:hypothetical protein